MDETPSFAALAALCLALLTPILEAPARADDWLIEWAPVYLWGVGAYGEQVAPELTAGLPFPIDVDISFGDVIAQFDIGATSHLEARRGDWGVLVDFGYLGLTQEDSPVLTPAGPALADVDLVNSFTELAVLRRLSDSAEAIAGIRYNYLGVEIRLPGGADVDEDWVDPFLGANFRWPLGERWEAFLRGDVGGFGVGSDFTWHAYAIAGYALTERLGLMLGYRYIDYDYDDGEGVDRFIYDAEEHGPLLGLAVRWGERP